MNPKKVEVEYAFINSVVVMQVLACHDVLLAKVRDHCDACRRLPAADVACQRVHVSPHIMTYERRLTGKTQVGHLLGW